MSASRKTREVSKAEIGDMYYLTINEISERTTYDRTTINGFLNPGAKNHLKSEKKNGGKRVVKVGDFKLWWESLNSK